MSACASAPGVSADARSGTSSTITTRARRGSIAANSTAVVGPRQLDTLRRFADAPFGMGVVRSLAVIAVAGWLGIMAFVSFGVAPRIFRALDRAVAGEAVAAILPRYYDWGLVLCAPVPGPGGAPGGGGGPPRGGGPPVRGGGGAEGPARRRPPARARRAGRVGVRPAPGRQVRGGGWGRSPTSRPRRSPTGCVR